MSIFDIFGVLGVVMIISAYFLLQLNKLSSNDIKFSLLNFFGSLLII